MERLLEKLFYLLGGGGGFEGAQETTFAVGMLETLCFRAEVGTAPRQFLMGVKQNLTSLRMADKAQELAFGGGASAGDTPPNWATHRVGLSALAWQSLPPNEPRGSNP